MLQAGFEPEIPASGRPQTRALDRAATEMGFIWGYEKKKSETVVWVTLHYY
jgi:hypothetical protein